VPEVESAYEIESELGRGGMGVVYLARHRQGNHLVALKVLLPERARDRRFLARFQREARLVQALDHPYVTRLLDHDLSAEAPYLAFDYVPESRTLSELIEDEDELLARVTPPARDDREFRPAFHVEGGLVLGGRPELLLLVRIARGLAHIHGAGLIHRDLKPANILVDRAGNPRIIDLGVGRVVDGSDQTELTLAGDQIGTLGYMAPEQILGEVADPRSDVYAFGLVATEVLSRRLVFGARAVNGIPPSARLRADVKVPAQDEPKPGRAMPGAVHKSMVRVLEQCLKLDRAGRPTDGGRLEEMLVAAIRSWQTSLASVVDLAGALAACGKPGSDAQTAAHEARPRAVGQAAPDGVGAVRALPVGGSTAHACVNRAQEPRRAHPNKTMVGGGRNVLLWALILSGVLSLALAAALSRAGCAFRGRLPHERSPRADRLDLETVRNPLGRAYEPGVRPWS
jgi:serine/threonine protein kinase